VPARRSQQSNAYQRAIRLFRILTLVVNRRPDQPLGRDHLARACACNVRTISRDLDHLIPYVPITWDDDQDAYVLLQKDWRLPPVVELTLEDALALALLRGLVSAPGLLPQQDAILAALDKAAAGLAAPLQDLMRDAARALTGDAPAAGALFAAPRDYGAAPVLALLEAVALERTVRIDYDSRNSSRAWRDIDPYKVLPRDGIYWELHGWCHKNQAMRTFALDRVRAVDPPGAPFVWREAEWAEFEAKAGIGGIRGGEALPVQVRFAPAVAAWARDRRWPPGLTITDAPDGAALLTGIAHGGTDALIAEILRWRRHAQVLGGPELRARMAEEVRELAGMYGGSGGDSEAADVFTKK